MPVYQSVSGSGTNQQNSPKRQTRPKSLAISTPTKLLSLEEARNRALQQAQQDFNAPEQKYIDVGGGPETLPAKYHTVIEIPGKKAASIKRSNRVNGNHNSNSETSGGWKSIFSGGKSKSKSRVKIDLKSEEENIKEASQKTQLLAVQQNSNLRPVRSAETLVQKQNGVKTTHETTNDSKQKSQESSESRPMSMDLDELAPLEVVQRAVGNAVKNYGSPAKCHSRSNSHDSYFESKQRLTDSTITTPNKSESALDLSEIQMNFDLEENEMRIFSEDEATMLSSNSVASSLSPTEENFKPLDKQKSPKVGESSPRSKKMGFKAKLKRFTSPTPNRKSVDHSEHPENSKKSIRDKIVGALSPESLRKKTNSESSQDSGSASKKKLSNSPSPQAAIKRTKIADQPEPEVEDPDVMTSNGIPLSPSINFIDATINESIEQINVSKGSTNSTTTKCKFLQYSFFLEPESKKETNNQRLSTASSTDEEGQVDQLVIAQVHHDPIPENREEEIKAQNEVISKSDVLTL